MPCSLVKHACTEDSEVFTKRLDYRWIVIKTIKVTGREINLSQNQA